VFGGWTGLRSLKAQSSADQFLANDGTGFFLALGRRNGRNLRTELDFSFLQNDITGFQSGNTVQTLSGELTSFAGTANAYWEFIDVPSRCFKPYLGLGVGFISTNNEIRDTRGRSIIPVGMENDTSLAYQWMGGVNYKAYRNVDLFAEYRFLGADTYRIETTSSMSDRYTYKTDNILFGFRWKF
jgi:opacity protein-like surface antigen